MNFDKILEYQTVDKELIALENELNKSAERAKLVNANAKVVAASDAIVKLGAEAVDLISNYSKLKEKIDEIVEQFNDFDGVTEGVEEVGEADHYLKLLDEIIADLAVIEREAQRDGARIDGVNSDFKKTWETGIKANEEYKQVKIQYDAYVAERQPRADELRAQLAVIAKGISAEMMSVYKRLRDAKKNPAFVPCEAGAQACKGCGLEFSAATRSKLKASGDYVDCQNCGRIIFIP